jgi:hypothetical protein
MTQEIFNGGMTCSFLLMIKIKKETKHEIKAVQFILVGIGWLLLLFPIVYDIMIRLFANEKGQAG